MDDSKEQTKFEIRPVIEQTPFEDPGVQSFFRKWCEINDSIEPKIIDRISILNNLGEIFYLEGCNLEEAVEEYQKFIGLADIEKDFSLIRKVKSKISILTPKPKT